MSTPLSAFQTVVDYLLSADNDEVDEPTRRKCIYAALERYSHDRPDTKTLDVTGDAGRYYGIAASLSGWSEGFSRITTIEYPAATIASDEMPTYLEPEDWQDDYWADVSGTQTRYLYLPNHTPAATEKMRITFTLPWSFSGATPVTDAPPADFYAICHLGAALCCQAISAKYSRTTDSTIGADSVDHTSRAGEYAARAREFMKLYRGHVGLDEKTVIAPAGEFVDWDTAPGWPAGRQFLMHHGGLR